MFDGKQVFVRPLEQEDLPLRVKWVNDPDVRKTLTFEYPLSLARTQQWFSKVLMDDTKRHFTIVHKETGQAIGMTGLIQIDVRHRRAEFYITIGAKDFWGKRIADEIIAIMLHYGFAELGLNRIYLTTLPSNERARKVYERSGFVFEGILRKHYFCHGEFQDAHVHAVLKPEWLKIENELLARLR